jgi:integrase
MAWAFNDEWLWAEKGRDRLFFLAWVALMASAGLRAGLEVEMTLESQIEITPAGIFIYVGRNKGKYRNARTAVCRGPYFPVERILKELFEYRRMYWTAKADIDACSIFADPVTGNVPDKYFHKLFQRYIKLYGWLVDKNTGQNRVPYSFRHFFITQAILDSVDLPFIAIIAGTSVNMINKYYTHITGKQAALKVSDISKVIGRSKLLARDTPQLDDGEQDRLAKLGVF